MKNLQINIFKIVVWQNRGCNVLQLKAIVINYSKVAKISACYLQFNITLVASISFWLHFVIMVACYKISLIKPICKNSDQVWCKCIIENSVLNCLQFSDQRVPCYRSISFLRKTWFKPLLRLIGLDCIILLTGAARTNKFQKTSQKNKFMKWGSGNKQNLFVISWVEILMAQLEDK